jgi:hypothetical protein
MEIALLKTLRGNIDGGASGEHTNLDKGIHQPQIRGVVTYSSLRLATTPLEEHKSSVLTIKVNGKKCVIRGHSLRIDVGEEVIIHIQDEYNDPPTVLALQIVKNNNVIFRMIFYSQNFRHGSTNYRFEDED